MKLSAPLLTSLSRCERRFGLEREFEVVRRRPREVFEQLLKFAVAQISNGVLTARAAAIQMEASLMEAAARPGFDTLHDPYTLTRDLCVIARTSLEAISRTSLLALSPPRRAEGWGFCSYADQSGMLHQWIAVERWDDDERFRRVHSWYVYGDCCAARQSMWLHAVEIGALRNGHFHSDWARCFKHPTLKNIYRFRMGDGSKLKGQWEPVWYQDNAQHDPKTWVDLMEHDQVELVHHVIVKEPSEQDVARFAFEIAHHRLVIDQLPDWRKIPMRRTSCDLPPCPWQPVCYGSAGQTGRVEDVGGFLKVQKAMAQASPFLDLPASPARVRHEVG